MTDNKLTYGETRDKLAANGYKPITVTGAKGYLHADEPGAVALGFGDTTYRTSEGGYRFTEHSFLVVLMVSAAVADKQLRASVMQSIGKHVRRSGPTKTDSVGNVFFLLRWEKDSYLPKNRVSSQKDQFGDSWISLVAQTGDEGNARFGVASSVSSVPLPLAGDWTKGTLLDTPFNKLPSLDAESFAALWAELESALAPHAGYVAQSSEPERVSAGPEITPYVLTEEFQRRHGRMPETAAPVEEPKRRWWSAYTGWNNAS